MELLPGFEPGTSTLPRWCSTYWAITACMKFWVFFVDFWVLFGVSTKSYQGGALPTVPHQQIIGVLVIGNWIESFSAFTYLVILYELGNNVKYYFVEIQRLWLRFWGCGCDCLFFSVCGCIVKILCKIF